MADRPGGRNDGPGSGWVDPDGPTTAARQQPRPQSDNWPPNPPTPPPHQTAPPSAPDWQQHAAPQGGQWPGQGYPAPTPTGANDPGAGWQQQPAPGPPWQGAPQTNQQYPPGGYGHGPQQFGGPTGPKSRKPLIISLVAGGAVVLVVAIVLAISLGGGSSSSDATASDTVKAYLEALSSGDAEKALSYSADQPANKEFLTDDILQKQLEEWPISNIRILSEDATYGMGTVHVAVNFGETVSDTNIRVKQNGDGWKLDSAAIKLEKLPGVTREGPDKTLTYFGKKADDGTQYVFPGFIDIGSSNPYVDVTAEPLLLDKLGLPTYLQPKMTLNDEGRDAVMKELTDAFAVCERSNLINPPGCPTKLNAYDAVEGTVSWGRADLAGIEIGELTSYQFTVMVTGEAKMPVGYRTERGETKTGEATVYLATQADMSKEPPELKFD